MRSTYIANSNTGLFVKYEFWVPNKCVNEQYNN